MRFCDRLPPVFPSPFPLPTEQAGTGLRAGEKLPESLPFPPHHPSLYSACFPPLASQPLLLPPHSLQQSSSSPEMLPEALGGAEQTLLRGVFGVGSLSGTPKPFPLHPKRCGCAGGGSSADGEELEQGCSFQINRCYLCNSKRMGGGEEEKKREKIKIKIKRKSFGISQLHKTAFALPEPLPCPHVLRQGTVLWECVCLHLDLCWSQGWGRGLPFSRGVTLPSRQIMRECAWLQLS